MNAPANTGYRFHGVVNIVRFNWPLYVAAALIVTGLLCMNTLLKPPPPLRTLLALAAVAGSVQTILSLLVSHYVYDLSDMYRFGWLSRLGIESKGHFANIHSGFDETSAALKAHFPGSNWQLLDFYDDAHNTEASIARARRLYPASPETRRIKHDSWRLQADSLDACFCLFAVHEIRDKAQKVRFFREAASHLKPGGKIVVAEHLRDLPNFLVFGYGFLHFFSGRHWRKCIHAAGLEVADSFRVTPFVKIFVIQKP